MTTVNEALEAWLGSYSSKNTKKVYLSSLNQFSQLEWGHDINELTADELKGLSYSKVITRVVDVQRGQGVKDSSIKQKITAARGFIKILSREEVFSGEDVDYPKILNDYLATDFLKNKDVRHHEPISLDELRQLEKFLSSKNKYGVEGWRYARLVDFLYVTGIRITAGLAVRWSDFTLTTSPWGGQFALLKVIDKGHKLNDKNIHRNYFDRLKKDFFQGDKNAKVFDGLSAGTLRKYFNEYNEKFGRHFTPHSLKSGAATTLYAETNNIMMVRDFCDHESVATTEKYIHMTQNPNKSGVGYLTADYDYDELENLSHDQLIKLIKSSLDIQNTIYLKAQEFHMVG